MLAAKTYLLAALEVIVDGMEIDGWGEGDVLTVSYRKNQIETVVGPDSSTSYATGDLSADLSLNVMQHHRGARRLGGILAAMLGEFGYGPEAFVLPGGAQLPREILIRDPSSGTKLVAPFFTIAKIPDLAFGVEPKSVNFPIVCPRLDTVISPDA